MLLCKRGKAEETVSRMLASMGNLKLTVNNLCATNKMCSKFDKNYLGEYVEKQCTALHSKWWEFPSKILGWDLNGPNKKQYRDDGDKGPSKKALVARIQFFGSCQDCYGSYNWYAAKYVSTVPRIGKFTCLIAYPTGQSKLGSHLVKWAKLQVQPCN